MVQEESLGKKASLEVETQVYEFCAKLVSFIAKFSLFPEKPMKFMIYTAMFL